MKKILTKYLYLLLCVLFLFVGCAAPAINTENTTAVSETTSVTAEETTQPEPNAEITISDEVIEFVEDTDEKVEQGEDVGTDEVIEGNIKEEQEINDEGLLETDGVVEQENISYDGTNTGKGTSLLSGAPKLTYYSQADSRWGSILYTNHGARSQTIKSSGCGPTSAAMLVASAKGIIIPPTMAQLFNDNGYRTYGNGTAWSAWPFVADFFDFGFYKQTTSLDTVFSYLKQDNNGDGVSDYFAIFSCGSGLFTTGGHYTFCPGYDFSKNIPIVYDPYNYPGKFNTSSRKAAGVKVDGNVVYVSELSLKKYGAIKQCWIYSNDGSTKKADTTKPSGSSTTTTTKTMYVTASWLNVRKGPGTNYSVVDCYKNGTKVTVYETKSGWSRIGTNKWVSSSYLSATPVNTTSPKKTIYKTTVGKTYKLKRRCTLYSKSNLSGTEYIYKANTTIKVLSHALATVDYIYVPATGRYAYCKVSNFT